MNNDYVAGYNVAGLDLNSLRDKAFQTACAHGFHDEEKPDAHWLMLVVTELAEAVEADRKSRRFSPEVYAEYCGAVGRSHVESRGCFVLPPDEKFKFVFERAIKGTVEEELADVIIRLLDFSGLYKIDLSHVCGKVSNCPYDAIPFTDSFTADMFLITQLVSCPVDEFDLEEEEEYRETVVCGAIGALFMYCKKHDINILWHIQQKMRYNELRAAKHGKLY